MKRFFIVHRWEGNPHGDWYQWLKEQLSLEFDVQVLTMPDPDKPVIDAWVNSLKENVGTPDKDTYFIGHSIGCQAILHYLETLSDGLQIGGMILVTPWVTLTPEAIEGAEDLAEPWLTTPIDWSKTKTHTRNIIAIFSDNDPYVPFGNIAVFKEKLGAKIVIEKNKGHMTEDDNVTEIPSVVEHIHSFVK